jgi:catalase (peroxidase I)
MKLPTDMALVKGKEFSKHVERYAHDAEAFFKEFVEVFTKLEELGVPSESKPEDRMIFKLLQDLAKPVVVVKSALLQVGHSEWVGVQQA